VVTSRAGPMLCVSRLSTLISKTPPVDGRRFIFAEGRNSVIRFRAARARGS
jgi:hypothetical protein